MEEEEVKTEEAEDPRPPPPNPDEEKELLFLVEFLVDKLKVNMDKLDVKNMDPCQLQGQNCVEIAFLHFPPLTICETDLNPQKLTGEVETNFKCGKSLTFPLTDKEFEEPPEVYLMLAVSKDLPHGSPQRKFPIGQAKIKVTQLFKLLFDKYDENPNKVPVSKSIKDTFELTGEKGVTGSIELYVRLTCLGKNVVTEFQAGGKPDDPMLFKNKESSKFYECKTPKEDNIVSQCRPGRGDSPSVEDKPLCSARNANSPSQDSDEENHEEIFAEINGAALVLKIEKSKRKGKSKQFHISEFCDCDFPLPNDLVAGLSSESLIDSRCPAGENEEQDIPDRKVGLKQGNQVVFQIPPVEELAKSGVRNAVTYNVNTCKDGEQHGHKGKNSFKIVSGTEADNEPKLPNDPEKDVFTLRIIKRGRTKKGKGTLELEFKIPKEKIEPPPKPPYMITREVGPEKQKKKKKKR